MMPGVEPVPRGVLGVGEAPHPTGILHDAAELVVGLERVSAGRNEHQHPFPVGLLEPGVGEAGTHFGEQRAFFERPCTGAGHDVLGEHVEPARTEILAVALALVDRVLGSGRLEELEAVARHQQRAARAVEPVVGTPDALEQAARALGSAHLHHQVDVAPVDAEVEAGGGDQRAQFAARHRAFDLAPRLLAERPVVHPDRQRVLVRGPQVLEDIFGQEARVGEDQRGPVALDLARRAAGSTRSRRARPTARALPWVAGSRPRRARRARLRRARRCRSRPLLLSSRARATREIPRGWRASLTAPRAPYRAQSPATG